MLAAQSPAMKAVMRSAAAPGPLCLHALAPPRHIAAPSRPDSRTQQASQPLPQQQPDRCVCSMLLCGQHPAVVHVADERFGVLLLLLYGCCGCHTGSLLLQQP